MRLCSIHDLPKKDSVVLFRNKSWLSLLAVVAIMGGITVFVALPKTEPTNPMLIAVPALVTLLFACMLLLRWRECRRSHNWILAHTAAGLYVNPRSYRNLHLSSDSHQIIFLPRESIIGICLTREIRYIPDKRRETKDQFSYLDIVLVPSEDLTDIQQLLRDERRVQPDSTRFGKKKSLDFPVRILEPPGIRMVWDWIRPAENQALEILGQHYPVLPDRFVKLPRWSALDETGRMDWLRKLWEEGQEDDVIWMVRMEQKISERAARQYVQEHIADDGLEP